MLRQFLVISCVAFVAVQAHAAEAGKVIFAAGQVLVADKAGAEGTPVQEGELLTTGSDGFLYVKTIDNGLFILRPNTKARIVSYRIDRQNPQNTSVKLELLSGIARSKSGDAVKQARQNFRFNTPVAAIGVRGTDFTVFTDQDTSRVAVLTGGVVVSGFAGGCRPEGGGPCEGATSRELFAAQRGQMLEVKRGERAPQVLEAGAASPDQVAPPLPGEPVAKPGNATSPVLDARNSDKLDKLVGQLPAPETSTPVEPVAPVPVAPVEPPPLAEIPVPTLPITPPIEVVEPPPVVPQLQERAIQWGRWTQLAGKPATIGLSKAEGEERLVNDIYVLFRGTGRDYVAPERGAVSFALRGGEASIRKDVLGQEAVAAQLQNGVLEVDFGKASFATSFDVLSGREVFKMTAEGDVSRSGQFGSSAYSRPGTNNTNVNGMLSNADGGSAAYLFNRRLDDNRLINGVTYWTTANQ